jgi:hypothetical protein
MAANIATTMVRDVIIVRKKVIYHPMKYDESIKGIIIYMLMTIKNLIVIFLFCYLTSTSRWRPIWPPIMVRNVIYG